MLKNHDRFKDFPLKTALFASLKNVYLQNKVANF